MERLLPQHPMPIAKQDEAGHGILYLVPTPIGNLEDCTVRAWRVLYSVDLICAEDTRRTKHLLQHYGIDTPLISYHEHNKEQRNGSLIARLEAGEALAVVTDAGMPAISDPGAALVRAAIDAGITVVPLPGPNAALTAWVGSGLDTTECTFMGFLPKRRKHRRERLQRLAHYPSTLIFYEAPHRLEEVLTDLYEVLGDRSVVLARELTKRYETWTRSTLRAILEGRTPIIYKGEFVVLVEGASSERETSSAPSSSVTEEQLLQAVYCLEEEGLPRKEALRQVAQQFHCSRRDVYRVVAQADPKEHQDADTQ